MKSVPKNIVIKLGGSSLSNEQTLAELAVVVKGYRSRGYRVALVHGGGPAINAELVQRGISWTFVNGQRRTTPEMIDVIDEVLAKKVNGQVVEALRVDGIPAWGLSAAEEGILSCTPVSEDLGLVGQVNTVVTAAIRDAWTMGLVPVIAPVGGGETEGERYNVNADWAATKIAVALNAEKLIFLTDQDGILDQRRDLVRTATPPVLSAMIETGVVSGGMCAKVLAMVHALNEGVRQVRVLNASKSSQALGRVRVGTILTDVKPVVRKNVQYGNAS